MPQLPWENQEPPRADPQPFDPPSPRFARHAELPDWFKIGSGLLILTALLAVTAQVTITMTGIFLPTPLLFLAHPVWPAVSILLVPVLVIYRVVRRRQRTWKIDVRSSGWANFFLWWGVLYYVLLGIQLLVLAFAS